jgi:hypothetical protein
VVLTKADKVDPEPVGQHRLLDDVADHLRMRQRCAERIVGDVAKAIEPKFERGGHLSYPVWVWVAFGASRAEPEKEGAAFQANHQLIVDRCLTRPHRETHGFRS